MTPLLNGKIAILPRSKWVFDVFTGYGWDQHSCFHLNNGFVKLIKGSAVSSDEYSFIVKYVSNK